MAKLKNDTRVDSEFIRVRHDLFDNGKRYDVVQEFKVSRLNYDMKIGSSFRECIDGLFAAYDENENKLFFRFREELINDKSVLPNLKLKENEPKP